MLPLGMELDMRHLLHKCWAIKNIAKWRCDDSISDNEFLNGIEYLVNQNIIKISEKPDSESSKETPKLIKTNSCLWASDSLLDDEFMTRIAHLVKNSTIKS